MMSIMGLESELNLATPRPRRDARKLLLVSLMGQLKRAVPSILSIETTTQIPGVMTGNGSRIYVDLGDLIEIATPEVATPLEAVISLHANEMLLLQLLPDVARSAGLDPARLRLIRCATSYDGHYRGVHVNVATRHFEAAAIVEHLVPFLATRFYACAGGFGPRGFVMSHKHAAVATVASTDARHNRGIIHLKDDTLSGPGTHRLHITHGDATMAMLSTYLSLGCTALVIGMLDDGVCVGPAFKLADPIDALRRLDTDYAWTASLPLASGLEASALDIQEHYLQAAERYASRVRVAWMQDVTRKWRAVVDTLRVKGPLGLSRDLDAYAKLKLYGAYLKQQGTTLDELSRWCGPVAAARSYLPCAARKGVRQQLRDRMPAVTFAFLEETMQRKGLAWPDLPKTSALCYKMIALDLLYHDVSEQGLFSKLCRSGVVHTLAAEHQLHAAMRRPPQGTRAEARARAITEVAGDSSARGGWGEVRTSSRRAVFADPTCTSFEWVAQKQK